MFPFDNGQEFKNEMQRKVGGKQLANEEDVQKGWKNVSEWCQCESGSLTLLNVFLKVFSCIFQFEDLGISSCCDLLKP